MVVPQCDEHGNATGLCTLEGIPSLVRAFNTAAVRTDILPFACQAPLSNVIHLICIHLVYISDQQQACQHENYSLVMPLLTTPLPSVTTFQMQILVARAVRLCSNTQPPSIGCPFLQYGIGNIACDFGSVRIFAPVDDHSQKSGRDG